LLLFRLHDNQLTANGSTRKPDVIEQRMKMIHSILIDNNMGENIHDVDDIHDVSYVGHLDHLDDLVKKHINENTIKETFKNELFEDVVKLLLLVEISERY